MVGLVEQYPSDYFLLIVDENLDVVEGRATKYTVSGSQCVGYIRRRLSPDNERRVLGLVRSANDSAHDIAVYNSRAHGFIPKAPIRKRAVLETIAPLWERRFMDMPPIVQVEDSSEIAAAQGNDDSISDFAYLVLNELQRNLDAVDEICSGDEDALLNAKWPLIWEKLHCLKGDLLSSSSAPAIQRAAKDINDMRGPEVPHNFFSRWTELRSFISANIRIRNFTGGSESSDLDSHYVGGKRRSSFDDFDSPAKRYKDYRFGNEARGSSSLDMVGQRQELSSDLKSVVRPTETSRR